jgi:hypothetical protein
MSIERTVCTAISLIPAFYVGAIVAGFTGTGAAILSAVVTDACGVDANTGTNTAGTVGTIAGVAAGVFAGATIVNAVYNAFED